MFVRPSHGCFLRWLKRWSKVTGWKQRAMTGLAALITLGFLGSLGLLRDITGANFKISARKTWVFTRVFTSLTKFAGSRGSFSV